MKHPLTGLRVGAMLLFLIGFLSPVALTGAGAQDLTCDDFTSERAAQAVLDADPDMEETLDPDGDGIACNHEEDASDDGAADDEEDAAADEEATEAADEEDATDDSGSGDADAYLEDVADTASAWSDSLEEILDIDPLRADVTDDEVETINDILTAFADAPSTAADFEAPEGLEDVQSAFEDLADGYAEYSDAVVAWSQTDPGSDEETEAAAAAEEAIDEIDSLNDSLLTAIEDAGGSADGGSDATDDGSDSADDGSDDESDSTDGGSAEGDEYLADTQELVDEWADSYDTWVELDMVNNYPDFTDADWDTVNEIIALWSVAPDDVSSFDAPEGYEDVQAALEDLADGYFEIQDLALQWNDTEAGSDEEAELEDGLTDAVDAIPDLQDAYDTAVEDAGGSSADGSDATDDGADDGSDATDDGTDDGSDATDDGADDESDATDDGSDDGTGGDADVEAYLDDVSTNNDEWMAGATRLTELLTQEEEITDADVAEVGDIIDLWTGAPDVAAEAEVPEGIEDVQADYEEVADSFAATAEAFNAWLATESGSAESDEAWTDFIDSMTEAIPFPATSPRRSKTPANLDLHRT